MKKVVAVAVACSIAFFLVGAVRAGEDTARSPQGTADRKKIDDKISISPLEAKQLIDREKNVQLIDVRSSSEFKQGAIEGSRNIPFIDIMEGRHTLSKDAPIILVCSIGGRSYAAGQILLEKGYRKVYNLDGGIDSWQKAGLPVRFQGIITR